MNAAVTAATTVEQEATRASLFRYDLLRWFMGAYFLVLGASFLILPRSTLSVPLGSLELRGMLFVVAGFAILWAMTGGLSRGKAVALQVFAAIPALETAVEYATFGVFSSALLFGMFGAGILLASTVAPGRSAPDRPEALGVVLGIGEAAAGLDIFFRSSYYQPIVATLSLPLAGMAWALIVGGAAMVVAQLYPGLPRAFRAGAHLFAGAAMLLLWVATALLDPLYWALGVGILMRGAGAAVLPWWSDRARRFDSRSLRAQLVVALATTAILPLLLVMSLVLSEEQAIAGIDPANIRKMSFIVTLLVGTAAAAAGIWLASRIARPLQVLTEGARRFTDTGPVPVLTRPGPTEVEVLARTLETMAWSLANRAREREALLEGEKAALEQSELERLRLQGVLDTMPEGVMVNDARGRVAYLNKRASALLGFETPDGFPPRGEARDGEYSSVRRPDGTRYLRKDLPLQRAQATGEIVVQEREIIRNPRTGRDVPILVNASPVRDRTGVIVGSVAVFQDVSAIEDFERARDGFFAAISHDLKSPLAGIRSGMQLIQRQTLTGRLDKDVLDTRITSLLETADRMTRMLDELDDLVRLEAGQPLPLERKSFDLIQLVRECVAQHQQMTDRHELVFTPAIESLVGSWDRPRIGRIVDNLLNNAVKYSPNGGRIDITLDREADQAVLVVRDQGAGIDPAELSSIFLPYHRASNVRSQTPGQGLGLASVQQIVEQHQGAVEATSEGPGSGAVFTVRLPLNVQ
jgi:PAS domain S-box-containing protein